MRKGFVFLAASVALAGSGLAASYVAQDFDDPDTGKKTVFWGDTSNGKDAYVLKFDKPSGKYYFDKVEKNKPAPKKVDSKATSENAK